MEIFHALPLFAGIQLFTNTTYQCVIIKYKMHNLIELVKNDYRSLMKILLLIHLRECVHFMECTLFRLSFSFLSVFSII